MATHRLSKYSPLKIIENINFWIGKIDLAYLGVIFTYFANLGVATKDFLLANADWFFPVAAIIKLFDWAGYTLQLWLSANKNAGKWANFAIKTMEAILMGTAIWGAKVIGTTLILGNTIAVGPIIFVSLFSFGFTYNLGRALYYATKAYFSHKKGDKTAEAFYREQAKQAGWNILLCTLGIGTLLTVVLFPQVALGIAATIAITAVVTIGMYTLCRGTRIGDAMLGVWNRFTNLFSNKKFKTIYLEELEPVKHLNNHRAFTHDNDEYYGHTIALLNPVEDTLAEYNTLVGKIQLYKNALELQIKNDESSRKEYIWSERHKRRDKIEALTFLEDFMRQFQAINNSKDGEKLIAINDHNFIFNDTEELIELITNHVTETYKYAFQSFFKDTGGVEALFKQSFKVLEESEWLHDKEELDFEAARKLIVTDPIITINNSSDSENGDESHMKYKNL